MPRSTKSRSLLTNISSRNKRYLMLGIAGLVALGTWNLINTELSKAPKVVVKEIVKEEVKILAPEPDVEILVAAKNLPAGKLVSSKLLEWQSWPYSDSLEQTYAVKGKVSISDFSGAVVRQGFRTGEPIIPSRLVKPGERGFLAAVLNPGFRAVSVPINSVTGIAGFIFPGDRVDVILTHRVTSAERTVSETVLRDIRVLAIDQQSSDQLSTPSPAKIVTVEVTPQQAERIMVMMKLGQLSLALRGLMPKDLEGQTLSYQQDAKHTGNKLAAADVDEVHSSSIPEGQYSWDSDVSRFIPRPRASAASYTSVRVIRAGASTNLSFIKDRNGNTQVEDTVPGQEGTEQ